MNKLTTCGLLISLLAVCYFLTSCETKKTILFPKDISGEKVPVSKPLKFSEEVQINWKVIGGDSLKPPKPIPFDIKNLPIKPFELNDFKPLKKPVQTRVLDWDNIPDHTINLDSISYKPIKLTKSILSPPKIVEAGTPKLMPNLTAGLLQFGEQEGLPGSNTYASLIDKRGVIWIATDRALSAYTGENLYVYDFYINKSSSGADNIIFHMTEDKQGRIWLATGGGGIYMMDIKKGILSHYATNLFFIDIFCDHTGKLWLASLQQGVFILDDKSNTMAEIAQLDEEKGSYAIAEDRNNNLWIGSEDHLVIINTDKSTFKRLGKNEGLSFTSCLEFYEDSNEAMWIGSVEGEINAINLKNKTLMTLNATQDFNGAADEYFEDARGQLWIIQNDSISILNKIKDASKTIITKATVVRNGKSGFIEDDYGNIWMGTKDKGIIILDPGGPLPESINNGNGLADNNVWGMLEDDNGYIWVGTFKGINIYDPSKGQAYLLAKEQGLGNNNVKGIRKLDLSHILVGTLPGFSVIDLKNNTITNYNKDQGISSNVIWNGTKDGSGNLWLTSEAGIYQYNLENETLKKSDNSHGLISNQIWDFLKDKDGNFWTPTDSGIMVINPVKNSARYLRKSEGLCSNNVMKIARAENGELWVGTLEGISIINTDKNTITNLTSEEGLKPDEIYDLVAQNNKIYAGSVDGMIVISEPDNSSDSLAGDGGWNFENYGKGQGFPYNDYNQMAAITTANGQSWWGVTPVVTVLTQPPLLDTIPPKVNITGIKVMDNDLIANNYIALKKSLQPDDSILNVSKDKYYLKTNLPENSAYMSAHNIKYDSLTSFFHLPVGLELPYDQNSINFIYSNINILGRERLVYKYVLEGADEEWSPVSAGSITKNYYNLAPGHYTFKVKSRSNNGIWSRPAQLDFTIIPPWWQTWWAYILYVMIFGGLVYAIVQYRSQWLKKENRILEERVSHRTSQLKESIEELKATQSQLVQSEKMASLGELTAGIAHEIQNPLNFVNNFSEVNTELIDELEEEVNKGNYREVKIIARDIKENEQKIVHHGKRADAIVKGMLQHSRSSSGIKEPTDINALADEYLRLAFHGLRAKDKSFNATMKTDFDERLSVNKAGEGAIKIIPQDVGRVILNLITNAFYAVTEKSASLSNTTGIEDDKYEPTVTVSTRKMDQEVIIKVSDNGNGIPQTVRDKIFQPFFTTKPTGHGTGLGLSMSFDIITKAHGGILKVETEEGKYTTFTVILPLE